MIPSHSADGASVVHIAVSLSFAQCLSISFFKSKALSLTIHRPRLRIVLSPRANTAAGPANNNGDRTAAAASVQPQQPQSQHRSRNSPSTSPVSDLLNKVDMSDWRVRALIFAITRLGLKLSNVQFIVDTVRKPQGTRGRQ